MQHLTKTKIRIFNSIAKDGLDRFPQESYSLSMDEKEAHALLLRSHKLGANQIPSSVMAISRAGAGVNNIPIEQCTKRGIPVFNTPGANANAVKELVTAALLLGARGVLEGAIFAQTTLRAIEDRKIFDDKLEQNKSNFKGEELIGKTLGVVGLGAIGSLVAEMGLTLGMDVVGYDPAISVENAWRLSKKVKRADTLSSLLSVSDYVTLHLPSVDTTRHIVNQEFLTQCKTNICLLNFARSELVHLKDLESALDSGLVRKYISDFPELTLLNRLDCIFLPHIGASTTEAEKNCAVMAVDQLRDYIENGNIKNSVNFPDVNLDPVEGSRIAITNDNVPKILGSVLSILAEENINVIDMLNKSRDTIAYNLIDLDSSPSISTLNQISALDGISNIRIVSEQKF